MICLTLIPRNIFFLKISQPHHLLRIFNRPWLKIERGVPWAPTRQKQKMDEDGLPLVGPGVDYTKVTDNMSHPDKNNNMTTKSVLLDEISLS